MSMKRKKKKKIPQTSNKVGLIKILLKYWTMFVINVSIISRVVADMVYECLVSKLYFQYWHTRIHNTQWSLLVQIFANDTHYNYELNQWKCWHIDRFFFLSTAILLNQARFLHLLIFSTTLKKHCGNWCVICNYQTKFRGLACNISLFGEYYLQRVMWYIVINFAFIF